MTHSKALQIRIVQDRLQFVIILWGSANVESRQGLRCCVYTFDDIMAKGTLPFKRPPIRRDSLATLVYTSGTTGAPKVCFMCGRYVAEFNHIIV